VSITTDKLTQPALVGGLVMGVLTALPIISAGNVCCCLWVVSGGLIAAYVMQQALPMPISQSDGALVGLLAGIVGAFVYLLLSIPISILVAPMERIMMQRIGERMPPELREFAGSYVGTGLRLVVGFVFWLFMGAIFSTVGGLIGATIFRKPVAPVATEPPPAS